MNGTSRHGLVLDGVSAGYGDTVVLESISLSLAPGGTLASEAAGRLIEARERAGDRAGAEAAAREYLRRFPTGSYQELARRLLQGDKLAPR